MGILYCFGQIIFFANKINIQKHAVYRFEIYVEEFHKVQEDICEILYFWSVLRIRIRIRIQIHPVFLVTRIRENTGYGSGSFINKNTPCYSNFLVINLSKTQFRPNNFLIFDFKWHNNFLSLILSVI